ncbi:porin [Labrys monachus]|uniref:Porin n=1 Tax=Labrys monachus TaxID=217067 RepID=A0ABU0FHS1_9HYPH|nr:porin [Labrys monachus]MDQ0394149.1 hypothetical protein [Labrys monachus]
MKKIYALSVLAGMATGSVAMAQDLPVAKAPQQDKLQACVVMGVGFWALPGTDTCLKVSGEVRADYIVTQPGNRALDTTTFETRGQIGFDARTATDYGLLRSYILLDAYVLPGGKSSFIVDKAYVQFDGVTAGYAHSFFGIYDLDYASDIRQPYFGYAGTTNLLAYTQEVGGALSATLSVEDAAHTRSSLFNELGFFESVPSGGTVAPDVVGNLRIDRDWGEAALFGAMHQIRYPGPETAGPLIKGSDYGFAAGGALGLDLPILSGAHVAAEGTYAKGASTYLGWQQVDAAFDGYSGMTDLGHGWTATGEFGVNLTPRLTFNLLGSYLDYKGANADNYLDPPTPDIKAWIAGGNAVYTFTRGLTFGAEVFYSHYAAKSDYTPASPIESKGWTGALRVRRSF